MRPFFLVALLIAFVSIANAQFSNDLVHFVDLLPQYDNCQALSESYVLFWTLNDENQTVHIAIAGNTTGYVALGFNVEADLDSMIESDAIIGWVYPNGTYRVDDYYLDDREECSITGGGGRRGVCTDVSRGGTRDISDVHAFQNESVTVVQFTRALNTGDQYDVELGNTEFTKIWSMSLLDLLYQHDNGQGLFTQQFNEAGACPSANANECSGNGVCNKGCCICNSGFATRDCSVDLSSVSSLTPNIVASDYKFSHEISSDFKLFWNLDETAGEVEIAIECQCTGWIAFGPSKDGRMVDSDVFIASINSGFVTVEDFYISDREVCNTRNKGVCKDASAGGQNSVLAFNGNENNGVTQVKWKRKLRTGGDSLDIDIVNENMNVVWGFHPTSKAIVKHNPSTKGALEVNFFTGTTAATDLKAVHGIIMFLVWGVAIPVTSFIARHLKHHKWWFNVHRMVNSIAVVAMLVAFIIALVMSSSHFVESHQIIGLIVVIIGVIQPVFGVLADKFYKPDRDAVPIFPDKVHWVVGWSGLLLALINILLGLILYGNFGLTAAYSVYFAVVVIFLIVYSIYKFVMNKKAKSSAPRINKDDEL